MPGAQCGDLSARLIVQDRVVERGLPLFVVAIGVGLVALLDVLQVSAINLLAGLEAIAIGVGDGGPLRAPQPTLRASADAQRAGGESERRYSDEDRER